MVIGLFILGMIIPGIGVKAVSIGGVDVDVVTSGDGLYADEYEPGRYVYKGADPDNYVQLGDDLWRIISLEPDGTLKVVRVEGISGVFYDVDTDTADRTTYFNENFYSSLPEEVKKIIQTHDFPAGDIDLNDDLVTEISNEKSKMWNGNVGMISLSDYLRANSNMEQCGTVNLYNANFLSCNETNYLYPVDWYIVLNGIVNDPTLNIVLDSNIIGTWVVFGYTEWQNSKPTAYLKDGIKFAEGTGLEDNPFTMVVKTTEEPSQETLQEETSDNNEPSEIVTVPSTSLYGSIVIIVLGIACIIVSAFVTRRLTNKSN